MNKDDRRYRGAYHLLRSHMDMLIASGHLTGLPKAEAEALLDSVEAELHPPEFEEVEVSAGWVNIYPNTSCGSGYALGQSRTYATKESADENSSEDRIGFQELRVKVKRPVKKPVVKEVEVEGVSLGGSGGICHWPGMAYGGSIFRDTDAAGKTVTLIARWTE